jgi:hypothetical protein
VSLHIVGGRTHSTSSIANCHSVGLSYREAQCEMWGFCIFWGRRASISPYIVAGYSFPPLIGEPSVLAL